MPTSIGSLNVLSIRGRVTPRGAALREDTRDGVDGHCYIQIGARAPVSNLITVTDVADVNTHVSAAVALKGTLVTVTHGDGSTVANVTVLDVACVSSVAVKTPVGGLSAGAYLVTLAWQVQAT